MRTCVAAYLAAGRRACCFGLAAPQAGCEGAGRDGGVEARDPASPESGMYGAAQGRQRNRISVIGKVPVTSDQNH